MAAKSSRILIVDDNAGHRDLLSVLLAEAEFTTVTADGVAKAKQLLQSEETFDLILSDVNMPGETGFDLIVWAKKQRGGISDVPVLFITSELPEPEHRIHGLSLGAVDYVSRTLDMDELVIRVNHAIESYQRLTQLKSSLENSEKRALAGRLLAASNHEIKNLAALIKVSTDQLSRLEATARPGAQDMRSQLIAAVRESSDLLVSISRNIGNLVTTREGTTQPVNLLQACRQAALILNPQIKPIKLIFDPEGDPIWVAGNRTSIMQILINLVLNAADAIREMGADQLGQIEIRLVPAAETIKLVVVDNGIGFSVAGERNAFAAFESTKHLRGGQGLGLWLCQQLAEAMQGGLTLASAGPGSGATATLALRRCEPPTTEPSLDLSKYYVY